MQINFEKKDVESLAEELAKLILKDERFNRKEPKKDDSFLTRQETAKELKVTLPTLNDYCIRGLIKSYRIRRKILFKRSELENSINKGLRYSHNRKSVL
jgi:excisionase family DNA binding protein